MVEVIFLRIMGAILLVLIYRYGKKKDGFVRYSSRGAYLRELNKEMECKE